MARAHAASPCVQSDSIKGLAQSIAKPAYHRLLTAEPALRRAVPTLIIAFLITICLGAFVQVVDQNRQKRAAIKRDLAAVADLLAERIDRIASVRQDRAATFERLQLLLPDLIPSWGSADGRHVIVTGADQRVLARVPIDDAHRRDRHILDVISAALPLAGPGQPAAVNRHHAAQRQRRAGDSAPSSNRCPARSSSSRKSSIRCGARMPRFR